MAFLTYRASSSPTLPTSNTVNSSGLSNLEVDGNFASLDTAKFEKTGGTISGDVIINSNSVAINATNVSIVDNNISIGAASAISALSGTINSTALNTTVTMTAPSTTAGLIAGMLLTKTTGTPGAFGTGAVITSVDSLTQFTFSTTTANTAGALSFNVAGLNDVTANGGGITLKGATDKTIIWDGINSNWTSSENLNIPTGKVFKINNTQVLNNTTLGSTIVNSSLTKLGTGAGLLKSDASGNLSVDTTAYLTSLSDTLTTVTARGATTPTAITITNTSASSTIATGALIVSGGVGVAGDLNIGGNLTVNGITTTINSATLVVDDKNIELGYVVALSNLSGTIVTSAATSAITMTSTSGLIPGMTLTKVSGAGILGTSAIITSIDSLTQITITASTSNTAGALVFNVGGITDLTANGGGITLKGATDKTIIWDSTNSNWTSSENLNIASGKVFKINNTSVLSSDTLGSGVTKSSITKIGTTAGLVKSDASGNLTVDTNTYLTSAGDGALTISTVAAAATNNTVTLALSGAYSANSSTSRTLDLKVGPALTNLATLMTTAGAGFIKRGATADTYTIDTSTYLTSVSGAITVTSITTTDVIATAASNFTINGAASSTTAGTAYDVSITGGRGGDTTSAGRGGSVNITGGRSGINASSGAGVYGGNVVIAGGNGNSSFAAAAPGNVNINGGSPQIDGQTGGSINIIATSGYATAGTVSAAGGNVTIAAGYGVVNGNNGYIALSAPGGAGGTPPKVTITTGSTERARFTNYGLSVGTTEDSDTVVGAGSILAAGNITSSSDIRIKTNITKIENALNKVLQLNGYTFDRIDTQIARQTGVIAQEVLKVLPEAVTGSEETTYSVAYGNMMGLMIEAIKELNAKVVDLQNQLANK